jgi:hypothetical protein
MVKKPEDVVFWGRWYHRMVGAFVSGIVMLVMFGIHDAKYHEKPPAEKPYTEPSPGTCYVEKQGRHTCIMQRMPGCNADRRVACYDMIHDGPAVAKQFACVYRQ